MKHFEETLKTFHIVREFEEETKSCLIKTFLNASGLLHFVLLFEKNGHAELGEFRKF